MNVGPVGRIQGEVQKNLAVHQRHPQSGPGGSEGKGARRGVRTPLTKRIGSEEMGYYGMSEKGSISPLPASVRGRFQN